MAHAFLVKLPTESKTDFEDIAKSSQEQITLNRISTWRTGVPYTEILLSLASAGSMAALAGVIKTWLDRNRGKIEVVSQHTGNKVSYEGPLGKLPDVIDDIRGLLEPEISQFPNGQAESKSENSNDAE